MKKLGFRKWLSFIVAGLIGQLAWAIENNFLGLYAFRCTNDTTFITIMTVASAAAATITTLLVGTLSDRLGKRKIFISLGYIIWGISIIFFAFLDPNSNFSIVAGSALASGTMIVIMDCVMTIFGSTANDACFNAFVTDNTEESNRAKVESVLSVLPLVSMIGVFVIGGFLTKKDDPHWDVFYYIFGGLTSLSGILCLFLLPKDVKAPNKENSYLSNAIYGFRPKVIKENKILYIILLAFLAFNMAIQVFMPYFIVYIQENLGIVDTDSGMNFTITLGVVLVVACIITVVFGLFMDKIGKNNIIIPAIIFASIGAFIMFLANSQFTVILGGIILMTGYLVGTAILGAKVRDYTPEKETGLFQGVRMVFVVLLPMVTGPYIGLGLSKINEQSYINEYGEVTVLPNQYIFFGAAIILLLAIIPVVIYIKKEKEGSK